MIRIPKDQLKTGMKLARPILGANGITLLSEGMELNENRIERINDMNVETVYIEGQSQQQVPKEEMLAQLDKRFGSVEGKPAMSLLKSIVRRHIEGLYEPD
ncbi:MAG: hypothetical protein L7F78_05025 [Syntrophales bacterium LBB04]|nr:hypothetical protein [Syntrophales bacterium LBB04]